MYEGENKQRLQKIYQILMEMADGNFSQRIPRTNRDDMLEGLTVLINWLGEEMAASLSHIGYVNPHFTYHYLAHSTYVLNHEGIVTDISADVPNFLDISAKKLIGTDFCDVLEDGSKPAWRKAKQRLLQNKTYHYILLLKFTTSNKLLAPAFCSISHLTNKKRLVVSLTVLKKRIEETNISRQNQNQKNTIALSNKDIRLIQNVYDYVLSHKDGSLPTLAKLARIFGTNEFKLKVGFRYLFNTSIYQLHINERLKRARLLIKNTSVPLNEIAFMSGYNTYSNFSRAFKIKYGCAPNTLARKP